MPAPCLELRLKNKLEVSMLKLLAPFIVVSICLAQSIVAFADETGTASMHSWQKEGRKTCFVDHSHSGTGEGRTKSKARRSAIIAWREFTAWEYGSDWASYRHARSKAISYTKAAKGWSARVDGRPCNPKRRT
jgi:hypothetical protein